MDKFRLDIISSGLLDIQSDAPWVTDFIKKAKSAKSKAKYKWRKTDLVIHRDIYTELRYSWNTMISRCKKDFYQQHIKESSDS